MHRDPATDAPPAHVRDALRAWYSPRRRAYPWRRKRPSPYRVLVSEVMLQQTQVARVIPAYGAFLRLFPTLPTLAAAPRSEVLRAWAALGYNRRAVALSEAARAVVRDHGGRIPRDPAVLDTLPGVGPYTAAAVASVAFGRPVPALDINAKRVTARVLFGRDWPEVPGAGLRQAAAGWVDRDDPGAWNQAVMDLGREVCRTTPRCDVCPLASWCRYRAEGRTGSADRRHRRPKQRFEGSTRQIRGAIVRALRRSPCTLDDLAEETGAGIDRTLEAIRSLVVDGLIDADGSALLGTGSGSIRLAD